MTYLGTSTTPNNHAQTNTLKRPNFLLSANESVHLSTFQSKTLAEVQGVVHAFTTRQGGVSQGAFESLNLGLRVDDEREAVEVNRRRVLDALGLSDRRFVTLRQVHGDGIVEVSHLAGRSIEADGFWTRDPKAVLAILVADCVPILIADSERKFVAAVHAGWKGTQARIAASMVERLASAGFPASRLRVALGPAIGPCCFEVGDDVAADLATAIPEIPNAIERAGEAWVAPSTGEASPPPDSGQTRVDLWALNRSVLESAGVDPECIEVLPNCTVCTNRLFSHRGDQGRTGRQAGVIGLSPSEIRT